MSLRRRVRLEVEALEQREVPALAPWTSYTPQVGDKVDALIRQLLPHTRSAVDFFQDLTGWLSTSVAPQTPAPGDANSFLASLRGDCTVRSRIFQAVALRMGIPVQTVALYKVPFQGGHEAVEVAIGGRWRFFDPTSGIGLVHRRTKAPLGLNEARARPDRVEIMQTTQPHFVGRWSPVRHFIFTPAPENILRWRGRRAFDLRHTYLVSPARIFGPNVD
jgi:transglutaminase-like putative cysteine protease